MNKLVLGILFTLGFATTALAADFQTSESTRGEDLSETATLSDSTDAGYSCVARAHYGVFTHPAIWGDNASTQKQAQTLALQECFRQMGWNSNCRVELCVPANQ